MLNQLGTPTKRFDAWVSYWEKQGLPREEAEQLTLRTSVGQWARVADAVEEVRHTFKEELARNSITGSRLFRWLRGEG